MSAYDTFKAGVLGNPYDATKKPSRSLTVQAFAEMQIQLEGAQAGALVKDTLGNLESLPNVSEASIMAWVVNDAVQSNNGIYENTGTASSPVWTRRIDIPQFIITGINNGNGSENAIIIETDLPVPTQDGRCLIVLPVNLDNTGPTTVSINGGVALPIKTSRGELVVSGELVAGMLISGFISQNAFWLLTDIRADSAAFVARDEAVAARDEAVALFPVGATMFPKLYCHAVALPQGRNRIGPKMIDRGDGRLTIIYRDANSHYFDENATIRALETRDDGLTFENDRQIYGDNNLYGGKNHAPDIFISKKCNDTAVILTAIRHFDGSSYFYEPPRIIKQTSIDNGDWTGANLTLGASLPANFGALWQGEILPWPASEGGHDTNGWIAFCYSQTAIGYITTDDNWATYSSVEQAIAPMGQALTEMTVMGNSASGYTMFIRSNGDTVLWASYSDNINGPWSVPVATTIPGDDSPPCVVTISETEAYIFIRSAKNVKADVNYQSHQMIAAINPTTFKATNGSSGFQGFKPFVNLGHWGSDYPQFLKRGQEWLMITSGGEQNVGDNTTHGGNSQVLIATQTPSPSLSIHTAKKLIIGPNDNYLPNGDFQIWPYDTSGTPTNYETSASCWRVGKTGGGTGHSWSRQGGNASKFGLRFGRIAGQTFTNTINCLTAIKSTDLYGLSGKHVTFGFDCIKGADFSSPVYVYVQYKNSVSLISSTDGTFGGTALLTVSNPSLTTSSWRRIQGSFFLPEDAEMLAIRISFTPSGTAGVNEFIQISDAFLCEGCFAPLWMRQRKYSEALNSCGRYLWKTFQGLSAIKTAGQLSKRASSATEFLSFQVPIEMHSKSGQAMPIGKVFSPDSGLENKAYNGSATTDVDASVINEGRNGGVVQVTGMTSGHSFGVQIEMNAEMW